MRRPRPEGQNTSLANNIGMHITVTDDSRDCKDESDEHMVFSRRKSVRVGTDVWPMLGPCWALFRTLDFTTEQMRRRHLFRRHC